MPEQTQKTYAFCAPTRPRGELGRHAIYWPLHSPQHQTLRKETTVRISLSHTRPKQEVIASVERWFNDLFQQAGGLPVKLTVDQRSWQGSVMSFQVTAKMGIMSTPIRGTEEVTDTDIIIDADLGMLGRFIDEKTAHQMLGSRLKGLLN
jgi:hypothetical protein